MLELIQELITSPLQQSIIYFSQLPFFELLAVCTALIYVVLAAKGNIWCWPAALVSTLLYTSIFYDVYLWMDSALQVYYMGMALYGWYCWRNNANDTGLKQPVSDQIKQASSPLQIKKWRASTHFIAITILSLLSLLLGWFMANYTPTHFPYFDAATTVFAVFATYLVTQKVLENWIYWIVIDFASIYLYLEKELTPTATLFVLYVGLALYGYIQWLKLYKQQNTATQYVLSKS